MPDRRFLYRARDLPPKPPKPTPTPRPSLKGKVGMAVMKGGVRRLVSLSKLAIRKGGQKGGTTTQARGKAYRWDSETARAAAIKGWKKRGKYSKKLGRRLGLGRGRKPLDYEAIRARHDSSTGEPVVYDAKSRRWYYYPPFNSAPTPISERAAMHRLGYRRKKGVPDFPVQIEWETQIIRGKLVASHPYKGDLA